jgi:beta-lactamase regulating signal transducer with metallopeptidase domain
MCGMKRVQFTMRYVPGGSDLNVMNNSTSNETRARTYEIVARIKNKTETPIKTRCIVLWLVGWFFVCFGLFVCLLFIRIIITLNNIIKSGTLVADIAETCQRCCFR